MSRDNFISDNLIKIRENLRQNPVKSSISEEVPPAPASQDNGAHLKSGEMRFAPELPQPAPRMQTRTPELDRERRELAGRIRRDYSCVAAELDNMELKRKEAAVFLEFLSRHQKALDSVDVDAENSSRELDRLAWEYYRMAGRWRAFSDSRSTSGIQEDHANNRRNDRSGTWMTPAAILLGAVIISIILAASFL